MPYIKVGERQIIDDDLDVLCGDLGDCMPKVDPGELNYVITRLVAKCMKPDDGWSYSSLSAARAIFRDAHDEFTRRLMDPYEDAACRRNGDIPEYEGGLEK